MKHILLVILSLFSSSELLIACVLPRTVLSFRHAVDPVSLSQVLRSYGYSILSCQKGALEAQRIGVARRWKDHNFLLVTNKPVDSIIVEPTTKDSFLVRATTNVSKQYFVVLDPIQDIYSIRSECVDVKQMTAIDNDYMSAIQSVEEFVRLREISVQIDEESCEKPTSSEATEYDF